MRHWNWSWLVASALLSPALSDAACASLKNLKLADATVTAAEDRPAGTMDIAITGPPGASVPPQHASLPAYCRVTGSIHPTSDSDIRFELWMPESGWNHRFQQIGNGGLAGSIPVGSLVSPLQQGWAVAATDDGHVGSSMADGQWAVGHPEKIVDFGDRAVHLTAVTAQAIVRAYYGAKAAHRYFVGCSDGGRESLMEAQRYPQDFDGFLAGAPAISVTRQAVTAAYKGQVAQSLGNDRLSAPQIALVRERALAMCDATDGVKDGVVANPRRCPFQPRQLLCSASERPDACLLPNQVAALEKIFEGVRDSGPGSPLVYGMADSVGSDAGATLLGVKATINPLAQQVLGNLLYAGDANFNVLSADLVTTSRDAEQRLGPLMNPTSVDLGKVKNSGKKIIQYHGWWDPLISPQSSIEYFDAVQRKLGDTQAFYRLFLVPGMGHCGGGVGPAWVTGAGVTKDAEHDAVLALTRWVEDRVAPDAIIATEFVQPVVDPINGAAAGAAIKASRPVCAYPRAARFKGSGSIGDAASYSCATAD